MSIAVPASSPDTLPQLLASDAGFDADHFLEFAEMAYFLVKKAVQDRAPTGARAFVDEPVYQQLQAQASAYTASHRLPVLDGLYVQGLWIESCRSDAGWFYLYVVFQAHAAVYTADESTGQLIEGSAEAYDFRETWTFARKAGVTSKVGGGVMEYKCPNCSVPLTLNDLGVCQHCGAPVSSGQLDWVVVATA